jgi:hypothetical protein
MSDEYYRQLEARLRALSPGVDAVCGAEVGGWFAEYLDVGEYGLAVEVAAERLTADRSESQPLAEGLLPEARLMGLEDAFIELLTQAAGEPPRSG